MLVIWIFEQTELHLYLLRWSISGAHYSLVDGGDSLPRCEGKQESKHWPWQGRPAANLQNPSHGHI